MNGIVLGYILTAVIVFFSFFYTLINKYKKESPYDSFTDWYVGEWLIINILCSAFWTIVIPVTTVVWCFVRVCKFIMKKCGVE
jgi:hypothetical protein